MLLLRRPKIVGRSARADAIASVSTASIRPAQAQSPATTSSENARTHLTNPALENAPARLGEAVAFSAEDCPCSTVLPLHSSTPSTPKPRTVSTADARPDAGAPSPTLGPDLHEALRLLRAAQLSLRAADATGALSLLDRMARRTPDALVEEREVTRVLAHCAANDVDSARLTAAALHASGAASVYAHRLSKSCVGPAPTPASLLDEMRRRALN